jgi:hypothetical protein
LSSAILYLAIVAIWAVVLVPRWLHPRTAQPQPAEQPEQPSVPQPGTPESAEPVLSEPVLSESVLSEPVPSESVLSEPVPSEPVLSVPEEPQQVAAPTDVARPEPANPEPDPPWAEDDTVAVDPVPAAPSPAAEKRADALQGRRRMLAMLVVLTAGGAGLGVTGIAAYWVIVPPAVLLAGFLVLLREAARIDAKRSQRATQIRHATANSVAGQEPDSFREDVQVSPDRVLVTASAPTAAEPPPGAEIIDISGRIGDQVYDQYSDAANRAVGD